MFKYDIGKKISQEKSQKITEWVEKTNGLRVILDCRFWK
jgi:hypothetical protein